MFLSASDIIKIAGAIVSHHEEEYSRFLDIVSQEWARRQDAAFRKEPAAVAPDQSGEILEKVKRATHESAVYCRRDIMIPDADFKEQMAQIDQIEDSNPNSDAKKPLAIVHVLRSNLFMLKGCYAQAKNELEAAMCIYEQQGDTVPAAFRDRKKVLLMCDYVRCLYMEGDFAKSIEQADATRRLAEGIPKDAEEEQRRQRANAPDLPFVPSEVYGYFASCDARIHHSNWKKDLPLREEYTYLWGVAQRKFDVPNVWEVPMKIAVLSDWLWVDRAQPYVRELALSLYIEVGGDAHFKTLRIVRVRAGKLNIRFPVGASLGLLLICLLCVADTNKPFNPETITNERVSQLNSQFNFNVDADSLRGTARTQIKAEPQDSVQDLFIRELSTNQESEEPIDSSRQYAVTIGELDVT